MPKPPKYTVQMNLKVTPEMATGVKKLAERESRRLGTDVAPQGAIRRLIHRELVLTGILADDSDPV